MSNAAGQELSAFDKIERVKEILDSHERQSSKLIPILQEVQEVYNYLPKEIMNYVAQALGLPPGRVYGVATFYSHFSLEPKGKYLIRLCDGTACHVRGSEPILDALREKLKLTAEKPTTDDQLFTIETVACLGACGLAPVIVINENVYGQVTAEKALKLVDEIVKAEKA